MEDLEMNNSIAFWDVMCSNAVKSTDVSEECIASTLSSGYLLHAGFLLDFLKMKAAHPPKCWCTYTVLRGVTTKKLALFIVTALRTSNQTEK
jgi:hypothetical protein